MDPLYLFVFAGLFTPGPNVILLTASGVRFGFTRTIPHVLGVAFGVGITSGLTGFGIGAFILGFPQVTFVLKCLASAWILWMAWTLWNAGAAQKQDSGDRPFTFIEAVLFQWVNPKVWVVAFAASSGYASDLPPWGEALRLASAFSGINLFVCLFWTSAGALLTYLLSTPSVWTVFIRTMAVILACFSVLVFL
jgi:threonine/homoserine/homoserine lactone efflux protein